MIRERALKILSWAAVLFMMAFICWKLSDGIAYETPICESVQCEQMTEEYIKYCKLYQAVKEEMQERHIVEVGQ